VKAKAKSNVLLLITALIWGCAFVAQRQGMEYVGPFTFNTCRSVLAFLSLLIVIAVRRRLPAPAGKKSPRRYGRRPLLIGGILCGIALFISTGLQQYGLITVEAGKAGFITALYIVLVPILGSFAGRKVRPLIWICVGIAVLGLWLLTVQNNDGGFSIGSGDIILLVCSFFFAVQILLVDRFSPFTDGIELSFVQFTTCAVLSGICMLIFEDPHPDAILAIAVPLLYAGILSSSVAYTLQIIAQKNADPTVASLLMSLESVFSVLAGWLILGEQLTPKELTGCAIMFVAIILSQLPQKKDGGKQLIG
jgi:drug/metabolite transporter (DMT)-like permease